MKEGERAAYLAVLGVEQWWPRAHAKADNSLASEALPSEAAGAPPRVIPAVVVAAAVAPSPVAEVAPPVAQVAQVAPAATIATPARVAQPVAVPQAPAVSVLQDRGFEGALAQARVQWSQTPPAQSPLAVLGLRAGGGKLAPLGFEGHEAILAKMLAAIKVDVQRCGVGTLQWGAAAEPLVPRFALILVDSGADEAAAIEWWRERSLVYAGARTLVARHPAMFAQGANMKRQAWHTLQTLQRLWSD